MLRILTGSTTEVTTHPAYDDDDFVAIQTGSCLHLIRGERHIFLNEIETLLFMAGINNDFNALFDDHPKEDIQ